MTATTADEFENVTRNLYNLRDPELLAAAMRLEAERPSRLPPALVTAINDALIVRLPDVRYADALFRHQILSRLHTKLARLAVRLQERRRQLHRGGGGAGVAEDDDGVCAAYAQRLRSFESQVFNLKNQTFTRLTDTDR